MRMQFKDSEKNKHVRRFYNYRLSANIYYFERIIFNNDR